MQYWLVRSLLSGNVYVVELAAGALVRVARSWWSGFEVLKTGPFSSWAEANVARAEIGGR